MGGSASTQLQVAVIDDDEIFRRGLVSALGDEPALVVIPDTDGASHPQRPDVAVVTWEAIARVEPGCPVVVLAPGNGRKAVPQGTMLEVSAILPRRGLTGEKLVIAVRAAAAGLRIDADVPDASSAEPFDERRLEVLRLLAQGADTRTIARELRCSERTVKTIVRDIQTRLGARTRAHAVAEAARLGLI